MRMFTGFALTFWIATGCAKEPYENKDVGADCGSYDAVCSTDGASVLLCKNDKFVQGETCADGCTPGNSDWFSVAGDINSVCCDNGNQRECTDTSDQSKRNQLVLNPGDNI